MTAAILMVIAVLLALQAVTITPTTPGTIDRDTRSKLQVQAHDALAASHESGSLSDTLRYWNVSTTSFYVSPSEDYAASDAVGYGFHDPPTEMGKIFNQTFSQRGYKYNVYLEVRNGDDWTRATRYPLVKRGEPTDNAVTATYVVSLYDNQTLTSPASSRKLGELNDDEFYAEDIYPDKPLFNVVRVRVVIW
jgi:hypothetical protein